MRLLALLLAALPIGHSVDGRAIRPVVLGDPAAAHRVLVVGCIHGNEPAGMAITRRLIAAGAPAGTEIVVVPSVNPDGCARGTRGNAHGVDLNRNFPSNWSAIGHPGSFQYSGPHPLSEPESRYSVALIERLQPQITIWFHQPQGVVRAWGQSVATARRFAALARYSVPEHRVAVRHRGELAEPPFPRDRVVRRGAAARSGSCGADRRVGSRGSRDRSRGSAPLARSWERLPWSDPRWIGAKSRWCVTRSAGRSRALEQLFRLHWPRAYRAALLVVDDAAAAEDIAQESFLAAVRALDRFDRRRPFGPWLHRIVVNRAIDWSRARTLRREIGAEAVPEPAAPARESGERADELAAALSELGAEHRAVVVLRYLLDYTPGEIAELLDLPRGTVNSRLRRGLDRLEEVLR